MVQTHKGNRVAIDLCYMLTKTLYQLLNEITISQLPCSIFFNTLKIIEQDHV